MHDCGVESHLDTSIPPTDIVIPQIIATMSAKITTPFGEAVPPAPRHSVTVHMGSGWDTVEKYGADPSSVSVHYKNVYPRMRPHRDIVELASAILEKLATPDTAACFLFSSLQSATECVDYAMSSKRDNGSDKRPVPKEDIQIRAFVAKDTFYAVVFPLDQRPVVHGFWTTPGAAISSRFAEANLAHVQSLREIPLSPSSTPSEDSGDLTRFNGPVHQVLRERIASFINRAPLNNNPHNDPRPCAEDVYLYQTGMASIYKPHTYMLSHSSQGTTVLFGMAFMNTITAFDEFGPGSKFFGNGSDSDDLVALEAFLCKERTHGRKVQAIWAEFPANPLLVTPNITRLRALADEHDIVLGIDDTIGSWANVDVLPMADILVTSVTKSFNGYADVIAGCAVLNPASPRYPRLKPLFQEKYIPELYVDDAETIERNSRDYLARSAILNANALALAEYLFACAQNPSSAVHRVHHPSVNPSRPNYERFMRPATLEFTPGHGCLLSVELEDLATTRAFYDNLNVHKSVHLGAPFTLAFAYTACTYSRSGAREWAEGFGLRETQIRISAGLEDTATLLDDFRVAVEAADQVKRGRPT